MMVTFWADIEGHRVFADGTGYRLGEPNSIPARMVIQQPEQPRWSRMTIREFVRQLAQAERRRRKSKRALCRRATKRFWGCR